MSFYNDETKKPFVSLDDDVQDLRIDLKIISQNCLFSFDASSLMTCDQVFEGSILQLTITIVKFAIMVLSFIEPNQSYSQFQWNYCPF